MQFERQTRRAKHVDLTPLVDVVFLLVIFFMLSTSFYKVESMELTLPSSSAGVDPVAAGDVMHLLVQPDGMVEIKQERYDSKALNRLIIQRLTVNPEQKMLLLSTPGVTVQQLVSVLDMLYTNGGKNVQIDHYFTGKAPDIGSDVKLIK